MPLILTILILLIGGYITISTLIMLVTHAIGKESPDWSMAFYHGFCLPAKFLKDINPWERIELTEEQACKKENIRRTKHWYRIKRWFEGEQVKKEI